MHDPVFTEKFVQLIESMCLQILDLVICTPLRDNRAPTRSRMGKTGTLANQNDNYVVMCLHAAQHVIAIPR